MPEQATVAPTESVVAREAPVQPDNKAPEAITNAGVKQSRAAIIRDAIKATAATETAIIDDDEKPAVEAKEPDGKESQEVKSEVQETKPQETEGEPKQGKARAWADLLEKDRRLKQQRLELKQEQDKLKALNDAQKLLHDDPVEFARVHGGDKFGDKWVKRTINGGKETAEEKIEQMQAKIVAMEQAAQEAKQRDSLNSYVNEGVRHWQTDEKASVLRAWYNDSEVPDVIQSVAGSHALHNNGQVLTHGEISGKIAGELQARLERFSKTPQGQQYLRKLLDVEPQQKQKPATPQAQKTLSHDMSANGSVPSPKPLSRREQIAAALKSLEQ